MLSNQLDGYFLANNKMMNILLKINSFFAQIFGCKQQLSVYSNLIIARHSLWIRIIHKLSLRIPNKLERYQLERVLTSLVRGSVEEDYLGYDSISNSQVLIRRLGQHIKSQEDVMKIAEIRLLSMMKHPNIMSIKDIIQGSDGIFYIILDYCAIDLSTFIAQKREIQLRQKAMRLPSTDEIPNIAFQLLSALSYLEKNAIVHGNLNSQNICMFQGVVKIAGFADASGAQNMDCSTFPSPENLTDYKFDSKLTCKSDIFSLGCLLIELIHGKNIFQGKGSIEILEKYEEFLPSFPSRFSPTKPVQHLSRNSPEREERRIEKLYEILNNCDTKMIDLILEMVQFTPRYRPTASALLQSEIFKQIKQTAFPEKSRNRYIYENNTPQTIQKNVAKTIEAANPITEFSHDKTRKIPLSNYQNPNNKKLEQQKLSSSVETRCSTDAAIRQAQYIEQRRIALTRQDSRGSVQNSPVFNQKHSKSVTFSNEETIPQQNQHIQNRNQNDLPGFIGLPGCPSVSERLKGRQSNRDQDRLSTNNEEYHYDLDKISVDSSQIKKEPYYLGSEPNSRNRRVLIPIKTIQGGPYDMKETIDTIRSNNSRLATSEARDSASSFLPSLNQILADTPISRKTRSSFDSMNGQRRSSLPTTPEQLIYRRPSSVINRYSLYNSLDVDLLKEEQNKQMINAPAGRPSSASKEKLFQNQRQVTSTKTSPKIKSVSRKANPPMDFSPPLRVESKYDYSLDASNRKKKKKKIKPLTLSTKDKTNKQSPPKLTSNAIRINPEHYMRVNRAVRA